MNNLYTIGTNGKSAKHFFELLKKNGIEVLIDTRLNNSSQLAGFAKGGKDFLGYLLEQIGSISYFHDINMAPDEKLLIDYKKNNLIWSDYIIRFLEIMDQRKMLEYFKNKYFDKYRNICLLCSEENFHECHRGIFSQEFSKKYGINVVHLK